MFVKDDSELGRLRDRCAEAAREAGEAHAAFVKFRDELVREHGAEKVAKTKSLFDQLNERQQPVKEKQALAAELNQQLLRQLGAKSGVQRADLPKGIPGLGKAFVENLAATTGGDARKALDATVGGTMVGPFYDPRIRDLPQRQLFVRSLIPVRQADGDKVWYLRQTVATQNAAPVAAGAAKPTSVFSIERVEETVRTVAHVSEALDRALLADSDELESFLDNQLRLGVLLAEEAQILNGNGTPPNLRGILNTAGIQTQPLGADDRITAIGKAMTLLRSSFFEPDGIVLHPLDFQDIRLMKNANGDFIMGAPSEPGEETLFGKPVVQSSAIAQGTGLVGAFAIGATVWDREQARVTFAETGLGNAAGEEMFSRNQVRFRGEERLAFGVERPAAFCTVTGI